MLHHNPKIQRSSISEKPIAFLKMPEHIYQIERKMPVFNLWFESVGMIILSCIDLDSNDYFF